MRLIAPQIFTIDINRAGSLGDDHFSGGRRTSPGAIDTGKVQLFNPVGSGITVLIYKILAVFGADSIVRVARQDTAIGVLEAGFNKHLDAAAPVGELRTLESIGGLGLTVAELTAVSTQPTSLIHEIPYALDPGIGLMIVGGTTNVVFSVWFEWQEV